MISIIIPNYNRADKIIETLQSIKNQTYTNWECIIVDDESTDDSIFVIKNFIKGDNRFSLFLRPSNSLKGPSSCRNYAFTFSKGNFIQFFDSDDIMHPDHLKEKIESIHDNDFVVCKLQEFLGEFTDPKSLKPKFDNISEVSDIFESFVTGEFYMLMMVAPLWKKNSIEPFMPIREDMHILEDHELYARIIFQKKKFTFINKELIFYRVGHSSLLKKFYDDINFGLNSYFEAKKTVLGLRNNKKIKFSIFKMTLSLFRISLAQKQYHSAKECLVFIIHWKLAYSFQLQLKLYRILFFFLIVRLCRRGDTFFKNMFKI